MGFTIFGMNPYFPFSAITAILAMISFFNVNSAWADKIGQPKGNNIFIGVGVVLAIVAIYFMYMVSKTSTGTGG